METGAIPQHSTGNLQAVAKVFGVSEVDLFQRQPPESKPEAPPTTDQLIAKTVHETIKQLSAKKPEAGEDAKAVFERLLKGFEELKVKENPKTKLIEEFVERLKIMNFNELTTMLNTTQNYYETALKRREAEKVSSGKKDKKEVG
jgi:hypothetical protein